MIAGAMLLAAAVSAAKPYEFQSIPLGITIEEFRALPAHAGRVACSDGKNDRAGPDGIYLRDPVLSQIGVVQCVFAIWPANTMFGRMTGIGLADGQFGTDDYGFRFVADPIDQKLRLYEIRLVVHIRWMSSIVSTLTANYGPPKASVATANQNGFGVSVPGKNVVWANALSTIAVVGPGQTTNDVIVAYRLLRLAKIVITSQNSPPPAKSL